jgi:nucleotide-binding universal stress UspA family protein
MTIPSGRLNSRTGSGLAHTLLQRVLCGVDSTPQSLAAVRQAAQLRATDGDLTIISALDSGSTAQAGWVATHAAAGLRAEAESALAGARTLVADAAFRLVEGRPDQVLIAEAKRLDATLMAVGAHGISRPIGIALGSVTTIVLHEAPCSVLVARERPATVGPPRSLIVGVDGSPESAAAADVAFTLAKRFEIEARLLAVRDGKDFDQSAVNAIAEDVPFEDGKPVETLVAAAEPSDLLIVGSRGLHGIRALGSVSERVAHKARCSVLVVRRPKAL